MVTCMLPILTFLLGMHSLHVDLFLSFMYYLLDIILIHETPLWLHLTLMTRHEVLLMHYEYEGLVGGGILGGIGVLDCIRRIP